MPRKKAMKKRKRVVPPPPLKEWWEEDWAIPVLGLFAVGAFIAVRDMRAEALAKQAQKGVVRG